MEQSIKNDISNIRAFVVTFLPGTSQTCLLASLHFISPDTKCFILPWTTATANIRSKLVKSEQSKLNKASWVFAYSAFRVFKIPVSVGSACNMTPWIEEVLTPSKFFKAVIKPSLKMTKILRKIINSITNLSPSLWNKIRYYWKQLYFKIPRNFQYTTQISFLKKDVSTFSTYNYFDECLVLI